MLIAVIFYGVHSHPPLCTPCRQTWPCARSGTHRMWFGETQKTANLNKKWRGGQFVCVCVCVHACVHACVCILYMCVCVGGRHGNIGGMSWRRTLSVTFNPSPNIGGMDARGKGGILVFSYKHNTKCHLWFMQEFYGWARLYDSNSDIRERERAFLQCRGCCCRFVFTLISEHI